MPEGDDETVEVRSTSHATASVSDIVVREGELTRLVFRPELVNNQLNPQACVHGTFIYQKRGKGEPWADVTTQSLGTLRKGESFQLTLKSAELLNLLRQLGSLYRLYGRQGLPSGRVELVKLERRLATLVELTQDDLNALLDANPDGALKTLNGALKWAGSSASLAALLQDDPGRMFALNAVIGAAALQEALGIWDKYQNRDDEDFWHNVLEKRPFLLIQLFNYPVVIIRDKAYVGGKLLDNRHGSVADFLAKARATGAALIIEIKTPRTSLLASAYRQDVYPWSADISVEVCQ